MNTNIEQYIKSGILEAYVTGATTPDEEREILQLKTQHPEIGDALKQLELDIEAFAKTIAIAPPPNLWNKIETEIDDIIAREKAEPQRYTERAKQDSTKPKSGPQYIDIETKSTHMRIHKAWKWVFAFIFIMGKIFLGAAIYFYLENRQTQEQIKELKAEIQALR